MKILTELLNEFIADFKLEETKGIICFDAMVYFLSKNYSSQLATEVEVVTIENQKMDVVYLLSRDIAKYKIPDMLPVTKDNFLYVKGIALIAIGDSPVYGQFSISIHPGDTHCSEETLKELHSKIYN